MASTKLSTIVRRGVAVLFLAGTVGAGTLLTAADTALAPEPARTTQSLSGTTGATGQAVFVHSSLPTTVIKWSLGWNPGSVAAGTPCSPIDLGPNTITTRVIQAIGSMRRCVDPRVLAAAETAAAREPVRTTQSLTGTHGATAQGIYVNSGILTTVIRWTSAWTPGSVPAGTPCSLIDMAPNATTTKVIEAGGSMRRCA